MTHVSVINVSLVFVLIEFNSVHNNIIIQALPVTFSTEREGYGGMSFGPARRPCACTEPAFLLMRFAGGPPSQQAIDIRRRLIVIVTVCI